MGTQWNIDPGAPRDVVERLRRDVRAELDRLGADPGDGELLAWELITNALRHAPGPLAVLVTAHRGRVRVEVVDGHPEHPTLRDPDPERIGGHGVELVDHLSMEWGEDTLGHGKAVWFDIAGPPAASGHDRTAPATAPAPAPVVPVTGEADEDLS